MSAGVAAQAPSSTGAMQGLRPIPKTRSQLANPAPTTHQPQHDGWDLQWRKSPQLPGNESLTGDETSLTSDDPASVQQVSSLRPVKHEVELSRAPVAAAMWAKPQFDVPQNAPIPTAEPNALQPIPAPIPESDFFNNPFGDDPAPPPARESRTVQTTPPELPPPPKSASPTLPSESRSLDELRNELRRSSDSLQLLPGETGNADAAARPRATAPSAGDGPTLREMLERERTNGDNSKSPSDRYEPLENPFKRDPSDRAADEKSRAEAETPRQPFGQKDDETASGSVGLSCEDFRQRIARQSIKDVSLDISPPFRPDIIAEDEYAKLKAKFDEKQETRQWRSIDGVPLASGRLVDLAYEKAIIQTEYGATEELSINRLSEADLVYIAENWGLPTECLIEQVAYQPRAWTRTLMTWKASNLCHKPLYFEEVNLERYGHTAGPFLQPVVSSAHFFVNIAVMPYKMGIHPPSECQYALGYYRPGNCAPWIVPPVPISLRGGLTQAAAMTGAFWLVP